MEVSVALGLLCQTGRTTMKASRGHLSRASYAWPLKDSPGFLITRFLLCAALPQLTRLFLSIFIPKPLSLPLAADTCKALQQTRHEEGTDSPCLHKPLAHEGSRRVAAVRPTS